MSNDLEALLTYLKQPGTDYAYMIRGPWGSGKSYFWTDVVTPRVQKDPYWDTANRPVLVYVSLYGLQNEQTIKKAVLAQLHPKWRKVAQAASFLGQAALDFYGKEALSKKFDLEKCLEPFISKKRLVICFDDLERATISIPRVLGHINQYVEHLGAKVVLLCDEERILKNKKVAVSYKRSREKVVRIRREFQGDAAGAVTAIIDGFGRRKEYREYLQQHKGPIVQVFEKTRRKNLRILKYGLVMLEAAFNALRKVAPNDETIRAKLIRGLLPVAFEFQVGRLRPKHVRELVAEGKSAIVISLMADELDKGKAKLKQSPTKSLVKKYKLDQSLDELLQSSALAELVITGHLSEADLKQELEAASRSLNQWELAASAFKNDWFALDENEFIKLVSLVREGILKGRITNWNAMVGVMRAFDGCLGSALRVPPHEELKKMFEDGLAIQCQTKSFVRIPLFHARHEVHLVGGDGPLTTWARDRLLSVNSDLIQSDLKAKVEETFEALEADPEAFTSLMSKGDETGFGKHPFSQFLSPERFAQKVAKASARARYSLNWAIKHRYEDDRDATALVVDLEWLAAVQDRLNDAASKEPAGIPKTLWLARLLAEIGTAIQHLKDVRARTTPPDKPNPT